MSQFEPAPLIVIVGETASGKSALALRLAQQFNGELICADSWTVRREVNIGTAKPSIAEQALVPHHLLNVVGPDEDFTAAVFKGLANRAIADITSRDKLPIMVGGTGLYVDGVVYDYGFLAEGDRQARQALSVLSNEELLTRIQSADIELGDVDVRNKRRLIRLLETNGAQPSRGPKRPNTLLIGIQPDRALLQDRITQRVDAMLVAGLEVEVRHLVEAYGWNCEALQGVGYKQWRNYLETGFTADEISESQQLGLAETRQKIIKATRDLAKRQRTWFKRNKSIHWFPAPVNQSKIVDLITTFLGHGKYT